MTAHSNNNPAEPARVLGGDTELDALQRAATAAAKADTDTSHTYECARAVWALWWRRYRELNPGMYKEGG